MAFENPPEFISEGHLGMMLLLPLYVLDRALYQGNSNRKRAAGVLPCK
jgi:hypothetical protein